MPKIVIHFEKIPVEVAQKILDKQIAKAKRNGNGKQIAGKSKKTLNRPYVSVKKKDEVLLS
jgi:hypothetical protein